MLFFQPVSNPNNRLRQPLHNVEMQTYPTYAINLILNQEIQLMPGKVLNKNHLAVVIQEEPDEEDTLKEEETPKNLLDSTQLEYVIPRNQTLVS